MKPTSYLKPNPDPTRYVDPYKIKMSHHLSNFNIKPSNCKNKNKMSLQQYHNFTREQILTSTTSQLTTLTQQADHSSKQAQAYTSMSILTESPQDSEPPSTPKRNNSDITNEEMDFKNKFVSPDTSENKRNKLRPGEGPMIADEEPNKENQGRLK